MTYVRELTDEELLANYTKSYTNGAAEFSSEAALWPQQFDNSASGEQSIQDYTNEKYF